MSTPTGRSRAPNTAGRRASADGGPGRTAGRPLTGPANRAAPALLTALFTVLLTLLLAVSLVPGAWAQAAPPAGNAAGGDPADAERLAAAQMANVKRLLETSTGARRVKDSDNTLAHKIREDALQRHQAAERAYKEKDYVTARRLLEEASKSMFQAIRILGPPPTSTEKKEQDFEARAVSTRALLDALRRIAAEDDKHADASQILADVEHTIEGSRRLLAAGAHDDARRMLDWAYEMTKAAVEERRDGKTLVRSLKFETPEHEYRYELDRNDTHHMLVNVVLQEQSPGAQARAMVDAAVARATALREQAEARAAAKAFAEGIKLLEESTKELVRAIRGAGLYIPG